MHEILGSEAECQSFFESLERLSERPQKGVRANSLRAGARQFLLESFAGLKPVEWEPNGFFVELGALAAIVASPAMGAGVFYVQEPGAMEAVALLDPKPGESCLDLCAAPGGKSTQIAERLGSQGWLVSNEFVRSRASRLDAILARHGSGRVSVLSADPSKVVDEFPAAFDAVLVDAPCSGESLFAKRDEHRSDVRDADVQGCARRQRRILDDAYRMLAPGGRIVYSTCTYSREENEAVVAEFLKGKDDLRLVRELRRWPHRDGVAGGYAALVVSEGAKTSRALGEPSNRGLIRHACKKWDGEVDEYALAMSNENLDTGVFVAEIELSDEEAKTFLRGESLNRACGVSGLVRLKWRGWPLGCGKAANDRINNWLPKILRTN